MCINRMFFKSLAIYRKGEKTSLFLSISCIYKSYFDFLLLILAVYVVIHPQIELYKVHKSNQIDTAMQTIAAGT